MLQIEVIGKKMLITADVPDHVTDELEIQMYSRRNDHISKFSDVSPFQVNDRGHYLNNVPAPTKAEIWYPILDIVPQEGIQAVAHVDVDLEAEKNKKYSCNINGMQFFDQQPLQANNIFESQQLVYWENALYIDSRSPVLTSFYWRKKFPAGTSKMEWEIDLLSEQWSGTIELHTSAQAASTLLDRKMIQAMPEQAKSYQDMPFQVGNEKDLSPLNLHKALTSTIDYLARSRNMNPASPTFGGLHLFYDHDAATFRRSDWSWTWGPSIRLFLEAAKFRPLRNAYKKDDLLDIAKQMGEASLRLQIQDPDHPAYGMLVCRWDSHPDYPQGHMGFCSPADSLFLSGWAWGALYEQFGDKKYLEAAELMVDQVAKLLPMREVILQDYRTKSEDWIDHTMDESGFGMEGIAATYALTQKQQHLNTGKWYIEQLIEKLQREDGVWRRYWFHSTSSYLPAAFDTRGCGWVMEGLLASHRMLPEDGFLDRAIKLAEHLIENQHETGCWGQFFNEPLDVRGIAEKGTALWSMLLYYLYKETKEPRHLEAARRALHWCVNHQYEGADQDGHGGIIGVNPHSGVVYRPYFRLSCTYTSSFFGLALIEEMKISGYIADL